MKVLVTGASGFVGGAFLASTVSGGRFSLRAAVRRDVPFGSSDIENVLVEGLNVTANWHEAVTGCDAVVHAAARTHIMQDTAADPLAAFRLVNVQGTLNLARQAAEAGVKRFVFISSIKVNGESTLPGRFYTADDLPAPADPYGISKYEAEKDLLELMAKTGMEVVIIRLPLVYGPGVKANFLRLLQLTQKRIPLPLGRVRNNRSMIYISNLVSAIITCLEHPKAAGEIFLVSDGEDVSTAQLIRKIAFAMGCKVTLLPIPLTIFKLVAVLSGKRGDFVRLTGSLCVDSTKIREVLNWQPPYTLDQGIEETVNWFRKRV
jgi:nucleoside-diphosphate-sugar epimerase